MHCPESTVALSCNCSSNNLIRLIRISILKLRDSFIHLQSQSSISTFLTAKCYRWNSHTSDCWNLHEICVHVLMCSSWILFFFFSFEKSMFQVIQTCQKKAGVPSRNRQSLKCEVRSINIEQIYQQQPSQWQSRALLHLHNFHSAYQQAVLIVCALHSSAALFKQFSANTTDSDMCQLNKPKLPHYISAWLAIQQSKY